MEPRLVEQSLGGEVQAFSGLLALGDAQLGAMAREFHGALKQSAHLDEPASICRSLEVVSGPSPSFEMMGVAFDLCCTAVAES